MSKMSSKFMFEYHFRFLKYHIIFIKKNYIIFTYQTFVVGKVFYNFFNDIYFLHSFS